MWLLSSFAVALGIAWLFVLPAALTKAAGRGAMPRSQAISTCRLAAIMVMLISVVPALTLLLPEELNFPSVLQYTYFAGGPPFVVRAIVALILFGIALAVAIPAYRRTQSL